MKPLMVPLILALSASTLSATEPVPFAEAKDVLEVTRFNVPYYAFQGVPRAILAAARRKTFEEHYKAVGKKIDLTVRATPPDVAGLVRLIKIPDKPFDSISIDYSGEKGGDTINYWLDFTKYGHASVHPGHLLATITYIGQIRKEYANTPGVTEAIPSLITIAECKNIHVISQLYLKLICIEEEPQVWDKNDKGFDYRNAACLSLGEFGAQAAAAVPALERFVSDPNISAAPVALAMIRFDTFARATDEALLESYKKAAESIPVLIKIASQAEMPVSTRLAAIELLGRFGADAKDALPILKNISNHPSPTKALGTPLPNAALEAAKRIEPGTQRQ